MRRFRLYVVFCLLVSLAIVTAQAGFYGIGWGIWQSPSIYHTN